MRGQWSTATGAGARPVGPAGGPPRRRGRVWSVLVSLAMAATTLGFVALPTTPAAAATNVMNLAVVSASDATAVTDFKFLINHDNTGTTEQRSPAPGTGCNPADANYPESCNWPSISETPHTSPIYTHGTAADLAGGLAITEPGRYLITVLADGFKIDGAHFTVPLPDGTPNVTVELIPNPLPDSTVRAQVFLDNGVTNGTLDQGEPGLAGFAGHIKDTLGEVSTDVYGNPLCTRYQGENPTTYEIPEASLDADGVPQIAAGGIGGECLTDADGMLAIPHMGSNRYTVFVNPPDGSKYVQTTTLEGNHDWDTWVMEGATGFDTEFALAGEAVPQPIFGFVPPMNELGTEPNSGSITGSVMAINAYTPPRGGSYNYWKGVSGAKVKYPIDKPWLALADLQTNDQAVYVGQGNADGTFTIPDVPPGDYALSWWDEPQDHFINTINVTVRNGEVVEMGQLPINGWWTEFDGYVFKDANRNGVKDPGEAGVPNFVLTMRKKENSLIDRGQNIATTDDNGYYRFEAAYPLSEWTVLEAYSDSFFTTGITYQADNQKKPTTVKGAGVDVSVLPIIGLGGRLDWGVHAYDPTGANGIDPRHGGIVGSITYDTTRNELDPQFAGVEDWQPGVPDIPVKLYDTVKCTDPLPAPGTQSCDADERYQLDADGSYLKGDLLNSYLSETWEMPTGCTARDVDGEALVHGTDEKVLVTNQETDGVCLSSPMQGVQFGPYPTDVGMPDANFGAAVDGNYGFGDGCFTSTLDDSDPANPVCPGGFETLPGAHDYLVSIEIPDDASGTPMYGVTREEDINIGHGDQIVPQVPPPACAGSLHTVDVKGIDAQGDLKLLPNGDPNPDFDGDGLKATENPTFVDIGGSPYEGQDKPLCDTKLVRVNNGKSVVPMFNVFTDVPIPSRLRGLIVDDINFSTDPRSLLYGEVAPVPFVPVGIYDFMNRLVYTAESDFNGSYDVLLPSSDHISCPTPSGMCANMYRFVANDPGIPGRLNPNWNPRYRSISTEFEALPGVIIPTDLAPTQVGVNIQVPVTGVNNEVTCKLADTTPQLLAVNRPYVTGNGSAAARTFTIQGRGFGATQGTGSVMLDAVGLTVNSWNDSAINVTVPTAASNWYGPHQLRITRGDNGEHTVNGLTIHVRGGNGSNAYNPTIREVNPPTATPGIPTYTTIQAALNAARASNGTSVVVVYPGTPDFDNPRLNPRGAYYENLIMASPVKLQGVGPGGFRADGSFVPGSIIDAGAFGGDTQLATDWYNLLDSLTWDGNQNVNDGEAIYVLASQGGGGGGGNNSARQFTSGFRAAIDGFDIRGGDQQGLPPNLNELTLGQPTGLPPTITTQGGAIYANAHADYLRITNNVVQNNGGAYGTIRIGTPDLPAPDTDQSNDNVVISDNRITSNAGTNLAGGIGLFAGSDNYEVARNDLCANFSLEYGAGMTAYGMSPGGKIHHNRIYYNNSNDEGGGIMIAGQIPEDPEALSPGSGAVDIYNNQIQANLSNDDGGGIRFLMAGTAPMRVYNNMVVNNVSAHEGGGISLNDATNVRLYNNTIMKNITTATAVTSNGFPAPAGLSTSRNSDLLQAAAPGNPEFSVPTQFNNIFWDNRAGSRAGTTVTGIGLPGDSSTVEHWDMGDMTDSVSLAPTYSTVQQDENEHVYDPSATNRTDDPLVKETYDVSVAFATWRQNASFVDATLVAFEQPPNLLGDYHLRDAANYPIPSPAIDAGTTGVGSGGNAVQAPTTDFDDQARPAGGAFDIGADEVGGATPPPPPPTSSACPTDLYFSTAGNTNPTAVGGQADDADVYRCSGDAFNRELDLSMPPYNLPTSGGGPNPGTPANVDGLSRVDDQRFYVSFTGNVTLPVDGTSQTVADEDVLYWNGSIWRMAFDGSAHGLGGTSGNSAFDLDAISLVGTSVGNTLYFSVDNGNVPPGAGASNSGDDADIYRWDGGNSYTRVVDASQSPYSLPNNVNVDGLIYLDSTHFYLSFSDTNATVPGLGNNGVQDEDVVYYSSGTWSLAYDLTAAPMSMTNADQDLDAISFATGAAALPAPAPLLLSTQGNARLAGVTGRPDNANIYRWTGLNWAPVFRADAGKARLPRKANIDGFTRVSGKRYYVSLSNTRIRVRGVGKVRDADILLWNGRTWSRWFKGNARTLGRGVTIGASTIAHKKLYFTVEGSAVPRGAGGTGSGADVYRWDGGRRFTRVFDATAAGLADTAVADGLDYLETNHLYLSFRRGVADVPGVGAVADEDVVFVEDGEWSLFFDGSDYGLGVSGAHDVDAFDVP